MFKMICPVCKAEMIEATTVAKYKIFECCECKSNVKISKLYSFIWIITFFVVLQSGIALIKFFNLNNNVLSIFNGPLIIGFSVVVAFALAAKICPVIILYNCEHFLTQAEAQK